MTDLVNAFMGVFDPVSFALITGGTIFGIIFGAIPGLDGDARRHPAHPAELRPRTHAGH